MDSMRAIDPRTPADAAAGDASAALAAFEPASMLRPGHAFSLAPLRWGPPPPLGRRSMPARLLTELARYIPVGSDEGGVGATPLRTPGLAAQGRPLFTTPPTAEPAPDEPPVKRRRPVDAGAAPALPARTTSHPLLATWHPLLAPSVAWPAAPMPPRALILNLVSDAADAALAYVGSFVPPPESPPASHRWLAAPASPGDAEGAEAMLALLHGDGGPDIASDEEDEEEEEECEFDEEEPGEDEDGEQAVALTPSQHQCSACGTCNSPMWRKHPTWRTLLCNACGLRVMRGRPPLVRGSTRQEPPRRLFHKPRAPQQPTDAGRRKSMGGRVNLGRADEGPEAAPGASTPGAPGDAGALRRPMRGWRPNPKFYGEDVE